MWILALILISLLVLGVLLLAPWRVICSWAGGLIVIRLRFLGVSITIWERDIFARDSEDRSGSGHKEQEDGPGITGEIVHRFQAVIDHQDVLVHAGRVGLRFARRFRGWWHLETALIETELGLGDPAYTGMAHGGLTALAGVLRARWPQLRLINRPDFNRTHFLSQGEIIFRLRAWDPVWDVLRFLAALPWRGLWKLKRDLAYE